MRIGRCFGFEPSHAAGLLAAFVAASLLVVLPGLSLSGAAPVAAQTAPAVISATLTPETATVGDRLTLTVVVDHDPSVVVEGPGFGTSFGGLELVEVATPRNDERDGSVRTTLGYTLVVFRTGELAVPPLIITYRGASEGSLTTESLSVRIESVLDPGDAELRPLKPQIDVDQSAPAPAVPALVVGAFAVLTAFGYVLLSRATAARPEPASGVGKPPPPDVRARGALDELAAAGIANLDPREFYARVAATTRGYLSERFGFPAFAMTRRELERTMTGAGVERWPARLTANLLRECDEVQFAGLPPPPQRIDADLTAAYEIIELTTPPSDEKADEAPS